MWPWEHVLLAYLLYSLARRATTGDAPTGPEVGVLVVAAVLPDAIDKPLSWQFELFNPSYGPGHAIVVAVAASVVVGAVAMARGRHPLGAAFALAYLSHVIADVLAVSPMGGEADLDRMLWPFSTPAPTGSHGSFADGVIHYLGRYVGEILAGGHRSAVAFMTVLGALTVVLWLLDGSPGVGFLRRGGSRGDVDPS